MANAKKRIPSRGKTMDIRPPKSFKKKSEEDFNPKVKVEEKEKVTVKKEMKKKEDKKSNLRAVSKVFAIIATIINSVFAFRLFSTSILPAKYAYPVLAGLALVTLFYIYKVFRNKTHKTVLIILDILALILSAAFLFATVKINQVFGFLDNTFNKGTQTAIYNIVVNKDASYSKPEDLQDKPLLSYEELIKDISNEDLEKKLKETIPGTSLEFKDDIDAVMNSILKDKTAAILVNAGTYGSYVDSNVNYEGNVKIIGTIEATYKEEISTDDTKKDITNTPFVLFINGIDTRTDKMPSRSLSDVNIVAAINPNTRKIVMVTTPRDYYVQLHGTTGLRDKLTHSGTKGGVKLSQATLEDLYDVKIDRYIRVNFNFVKKLVDAIGGISIYNDVDYAIHTNDVLNRNDKCTIQPGWNEVNGKCALGFARERKQYKDGDRHRGRNQMHVIEQIIKKVTSASTLLSKYSDIMKSLEGTFDTSISTEDITSLVRMQLDDMASWEVEQYSVNGKGQLTKTYSYPNQNLYVMFPDKNTVNTAKEKIKKVLSE